MVMQHVNIYTRQTEFMGENAAGPVKVNTNYCLSLDFELCIYKGFFLYQFTGAGTILRVLKFQSTNQ